VPFLIVSDIHANREALEAVLDDARGLYDRIVCLGDLAGYGADPNFIVEWARANVSAIVRGNHDKVCVGLESLYSYRRRARRRSGRSKRSLLKIELISKGFRADRCLMKASIWCMGRPWTKTNIW
jgi:predicted phosphodiesterase